MTRKGFTLIELMVVIFVMAIVLTMGVPLVYKTFKKEPMRQAISDVMEVCSRARALAILQGTVAEAVFHPPEGRFEVSGGSAPPPPRADITLDVVTIEPPKPPPPKGSGMSGQLPEGLEVEMLDINLLEYRTEEVARVRFYPNGTCDEMTIIMRYGTDQRGVMLEATTGLAIMLTQADLQNLRSGRL